MPKTKAMATSNGHKLWSARLFIPSNTILTTTTAGYVAPTIIPVGKISALLTNGNTNAVTPNKRNVVDGTSAAKNILRKSPANKTIPP